MLRTAWLLVLSILLTNVPCAFRQTIVRADDFAQSSAVSDLAHPETVPQQSDVLLHHRIDQLIRRDAIGPLATLCSDEEFIRRVTLDLAGQIPSVNQLRTFVADNNQHKRELLIDQLLDSDEFVRHFAQHLNVTLLERRTDKYVPETDWERFLVESIIDNQPLDQLFQSLLSPPQNQPEAVAAKFILNSDAEPNAVTREIGRMTFGMDLQCAQCHDHPLIADYYQEDYYGLFAFVQRTGQFADPKSKKIRLTEKAEGVTSFKSVFTGDGREKQFPRLPKGKAVWSEPDFPKGDEFEVAPQKNIPGIPKYSRRAALATMLPESHLFQRNLANRLWAMVMGRGLVHPLDHHHEDNPPSNPELLTLLASELRAGGYDARKFLKSIVLTQAYQRSCEAPAPDTINIADINSRIQSLRQLKVTLEPTVNDASAAARTAEQELENVVAANLAIDARVAMLQAPVTDAQKQVDQATTDLKAARSAQSLLLRQLASLQSVRDSTVTATGSIMPVADTDATNREAENLLVTAHQLMQKHIDLSQKKIKEALDHVAVAETRLQSALDQKQSAVQAVANMEATKTSVADLQLLEQTKLNSTISYRNGNYRLHQLDQMLALCEQHLKYAAITGDQPETAQLLWQSIVEQSTIACQIAPLKPLSPEQLAASIMQATGVLPLEINAVEDALQKKPPKINDQAADHEKQRAMRSAVNTGVLNRTRNTFRQFVTYYGGLPGEDFQATAGQALFFGNSSVIDGWLQPRSNNLTARLAPLTDTDDLVEEIYLSIFGRTATTAEQREIKKLLQQYPDERHAILTEFIWAMLSSTEFRFNH